jgi:hypothetical protein
MDKDYRGRAVYTVDWWLRWGGFILLLATLGLVVWWSLIWYRERMFHFDPAFYLFQLVHTGEYQLYYDRYIIALTAWLPLWVHHSGASLVSVAKAYSVSLPLVILVTCAGLVAWKRSPWLALLLLFTMITPVRYRFFSPTSETHMVLLFGYLYFVFSDHLTEKPLRFGLLSLAAIVGSAMAHLVALGPIIFLWLISAVDGKWRQKAWRFGHLAAIALLFSWRFIGAQSNAYEANKMGILTELPQVIEDLLGSQAFQQFWEYALGTHSLMWGLFVTCIVVLWKQGKRGITILSLLFAAAIAALVWVAYSYLNFREYHMYEGYLTFLGLVWVVPLYYLFRVKKAQPLLALGVTLSLAVSLWQIQATKTYYTERENYLREIYQPWQQKGHKKLYLDQDIFPWRQLWYPWSIPFETMLMTASEDPDSSLTLLINNRYSNRQVTEKDRHNILTPWERIHHKKLDTAYFRFPVQDYLDVSSSGLPDKFFDEK